MKNTVKVTENPPAEVAVISCLIFEPAFIGEHGDRLTPELFISGLCRRAVEIIKAEYAERGTVDVPSIYQKNAEVGDAVFKWYGDFDTAPDIKRYIKLLEDAAAQRHLQALAERIMANVGAGEHPDNTLTAIAEATANIHAPFGEIAPLDLDTWRAEMRVAPTGRKTGYDGLDTAFELAPGAVHYVVGYTGHGKTTFLVNLALNFLRDYHDPVLYFSLEETRLDLVGRFVSTLCGPEGLSIKSVKNYFKGGPDTRAENAVIEGAYSRLAELGPRLYLEDKGDLTTADIARLTRGAAKAHGGVGLVLVDYVQLITPPAIRNQYRYLELGDISQALLAIAKNNGVPVIAAAQARRPQGQRGDVAPPPKLHDLRESANLEQDAALVLGLYSPGGVVETENYDTTLRIEVLKSRYGPKGEIINLDYHKAPGVIIDGESEVPVF